MNSPSFYLALIAGAAGSIALVALYTALGRGKAAVIVPLTALYPAVTIILSLLILG